MSCRKCGVKKPPVDFYDGKSTCKTCLAAYFRHYYRTHTARKRAAQRGHHHDGDPDEVRELPRASLPSVAIYLKEETFYHARCECPLVLIGYLPSNDELHFRCHPCRESVFLPTVAVERIATR
jgi:hypothetical protein